MCFRIVRGTGRDSATSGVPLFIVAQLVDDVLLTKDAHPSLARICFVDPDVELRRREVDDSVCGVEESPKVSTVDTARPCAWHLPYWFGQDLRRM